MRSPAALQAMLLSTAQRCCCLGGSQVAAAAFSTNSAQQQLHLHVAHQLPACSAQAAAPRFTPYNAWATSSSGGTRGFFSGQPESKVYKERRLIGYSPEQLYEVVSNVQQYSQFVPWCVGSTVLTRQQDGRYLEAELQIGFQMISERYTSKVTLQPPHQVSSTVADSALFHHLESTWQMTPGPSPNSTWLSFSVDFAFMNPLYANVAHLFFSEVVQRMMGAFEGRCRELYGHPSFAAPSSSSSSRRHKHQQQRVHHLHHVPAGVQQQQHHALQQQQQQQQVVAAVGSRGGGEQDMQ